MITTVAGGANRDGETAETAQFDFPRGLAVAGGNVYIADANTNLVRKLASDRTLATIGGGGATILVVTRGPRSWLSLSRYEQPAYSKSHAEWRRYYDRRHGNCRIRRR